MAQAESRPWDLIRIMPAWESDASRGCTCGPTSSNFIMPVFLFVRELLAWSVTVIALLPIMIPWSVLAYKIWHGAKEIEEEMSEELWSRAWRVNLLLFFVAPLFIVLDYFVADETWLGLPAGVTHIVFWIGLVSFVAWMMMYFFSQEDFFQGLMLATIYLYLPVFVLFLISLLFTNPLQAYLLTWLTRPSERSF